MIKNLFFIALLFLLSSCCCFVFSHYKNSKQLFISSLLDGPRAFLDDYELVYYINGKKTTIYSYRLGLYGPVFSEDSNGPLESYEAYYCNLFVPGGDVFGCENKLRGKANIEIYLEKEGTKELVLLAKKTIDMDAYFRSVLVTQVYWGTNKEDYVPRPGRNIDWEKVETIVWPNTTDTISHYTAWYWDKRDSYEKYSPNEKYFVEIP